MDSGYPFYAGSFVFKTRFNWGRLLKNKVFIEFEKFDTITAKVVLNKKQAGLVFWPPYRVEITKFLKKGENILEIELTNSLRNLLGPHHNTDKEEKRVTPVSFTDKNNWTDRYNFVKFGLGKIRIG